MTVTDAPMIPDVRRVVACGAETGDTVTLTLSAPGPGDRWPEPPQPGQFFMLGTFGMGEAPISVSRFDPASGQVQCTVRGVGVVTDALTAAEAGDPVLVRGPFGVGWDVAAAHGRDVVVMAGGIGLAPVRPVVDALLGEPDRKGSLVLLVGARTPDDLCFADDLDRWAADDRLHLGVTVDRPVSQGRPWGGAVGVVTTLIAAAPFDPATTTAYVCGPEVMMRFAVRGLVERGVDRAAVAVSAERSMTCGIGHCGHCQLGPLLICRDGPVMGADRFGALVKVKER